MQKNCSLIFWQPRNAHFLFNWLISRLFLSLGTDFCVSLAQILFLARWWNPPFLLFRQLRGLRNQLRWAGMHWKLPGNQFWEEVPTLFFFVADRKKLFRKFFCHLGWAACMQWYAVNCAVEEKKGGDCETNKLEAKPQNQPGSFNPRIPPIRLQEMIKNCQKRNPIKNSNWKFQH